MAKLSGPHTSWKSAVQAACLIFAGLLAACDDGSRSNVSAPAAMEAKLKGSVTDQHGPILNSRLEVTDKNGKVVLTTSLTDTNQYSITVPSGTLYPIVITAYPTGESAANSTPVKAVITSALADRQDVTDVSTIVVDSALSIGGLTPENIAKASGAAIGLRQREGVSAATGGGGAGPGQSGGGVSRGGHGGHVAPGESGGGQTGQPHSGQMPPGSGTTSP